MYNVRNVSGKDLAVMLEKGGVILRPNKCVDLDIYCSRRWILSNFDLRKLVTKGFLQLTHDSRAVLPKAPVKPIKRMPVGIAPKKVVSNKPVEIVDLVSFPDVEIDDRGQVNIQKDAVKAVELAVKAVELEKIDQPVEIATPVVPAPVVEIEAKLVEELVEELAVEAKCEKAEVEAQVEIVNEVRPEEQEEKTEEVEEKQEEKTEEEVVFGGFEFSKSKKKKHLKTRR